MFAATIQSAELVLISGGIPEITLTGPLILSCESALPPDLTWLSQFFSAGASFWGELGEPFHSVVRINCSAFGELRNWR